MTLRRGPPGDCPWVISDNRVIFTYTVLAIFNYMRGFWLCRNRLWARRFSPRAMKLRQTYGQTTKFYWILLPRKHHFSGAHSRQTNWSGDRFFSEIGSIYWKSPVLSHFQNFMLVWKSLGFSWAFYAARRHSALCWNPTPKEIVPTTERSKVRRLLTLMCIQKARRQLKRGRAGISGLSRWHYRL